MTFSGILDKLIFWYKPNCPKNYEKTIIINQKLCFSGRPVVTLNLLYELFTLHVVSCKGTIDCKFS